MKTIVTYIVGCNLKRKFNIFQSINKFNFAMEIGEPEFTSNCFNCSGFCTIFSCAVFDCSKLYIRLTTAFDLLWVERWEDHYVDVLHSVLYYYVQMFDIVSWIDLKLHWGVHYVDVMRSPVDIDIGWPAAWRIFPPAKANIREYIKLY